MTYWGLRAYAGEQRQVWGGEPEHVHEWGTEGERRSSGGLNSTSIGNGAGQGTSVGSLFVASTGAFCACGAWYGALGLEPTPELYVEHMVEVFREVRRVLRPDGTLWLNIGDSYAASRSGPFGDTSTLNGSRHAPEESRKAKESAGRPNSRWRFDPWGLKPKDLVGAPWRVALALQADGWWLRSDIVWAKPNPMPESVRDRPTKSHEYLFLLTKGGDATGWRHDRTGEWVRWPGQRPPADYRWVEPRPDDAPLRWARESLNEVAGWRRINLWRGFDYYFDADAVRERAIHAGRVVRASGAVAKNGVGDAVNDRRIHAGFTVHDTEVGEGRNVRSVWEIATRPYAEAHFATFPPALPERCILAGSAPGDVVLDPFVGSGTTVMVAERLGRRGVGLDLSTEYLEMARRRVAEDRWQPSDRLGAAQARAAVADRVGGAAQGVLPL